MVPDTGEPVGGQAADQPNVGFLVGPVMILIGALIGVATVRLGVLVLPGGDLVRVDHDRVVLNPRSKGLKLLGVVVGADPGLDPVVPTVQVTDQVVAGDVAVGQHSPAVKTASVEDRHGVVGAYDDQIDAANERPGWVAIGEGAPLDERDRFHKDSCG